MNTKRSLRTYVMVAIAAYCGNTAFAQELAIEEITVTAQKRQESVQDVPLSITALDRSAIEQAGMTNLASIVSSVPGLNVRDDGASQSVFAIRGVGTSAFSVSADASVGVFIDDVYAGHPLISNFSFFDVDRIEVVKGPQGTLFGRNTSAGAINIVSKKPDRDERYADLRFGFGNMGQQIYEGIANFSNSGDGGIRVAAQYQERDGTFENATTGAQINDKKDLMVRVNMEKDFSDQFRSNILLEYIDIDSRTGLTALDPDDREGSASISSVDQNARDSQEMGILRSALRLEYDIGDALTLTSTTSYLDADLQTTPIDFDITTFRVLEFSEPNTFEYLSQELRLNGGSDDIDWFVGASVRDESNSSNTRLRYSDFDLMNVLVGDTCPNVMASIPAPASLCTDMVTEDSIAYADNFSWGIYGDVAWQLTDRLKVTFGGRYSYDKKEIAQNTPSADTATSLVLGGNVLELTTVGTVTADKTWDNFSPRLALSYDISGDTMVYGNISQGYKAGGFNSSPNIDAAALAPGETQFVPSFDPEESTAYELGVKSLLLDKRLQLNVAGYFTDYENYQLESNMGVAFFVENVADAEIYGAEVEARLLLTENLDVSVGYAYLNTEIKRGTIDLGGTPIDIVGNPMPLAPENSLSLVSNYTWPTSLGDVRFRLAYNYQDDQYISAFADDVVERLESHFNLDAGISLTSSNEVWAFEVIGQNVTDERYFSGFAVTILEPIGMPNIGALWRAEFRYRFD